MKNLIITALAAIMFVACADSGETEYRYYIYDGEDFQEVPIPPAARKSEEDEERTGELPRELPFLDTEGCVVLKSTATLRSGGVIWSGDIVELEEEDCLVIQGDVHVYKSSPNTAFPQIKAIDGNLRMDGPAKLPNLTHISRDVVVTTNSNPVSKLEVDELLEMNIEYIGGRLIITQENSILPPGWLYDVDLLGPLTWIAGPIHAYFNDNLCNNSAEALADRLGKSKENIYTNCQPIKYLP